MRTCLHRRGRQSVRAGLRERCAHRWPAIAAKRCQLLSNRHCSIVQIGLKSLHDQCCRASRERSSSELHVADSLDLAPEPTCTCTRASKLLRSGRDPALCSKSIVAAYAALGVQRFARRHSIIIIAALHLTLAGLSQSVLLPLWNLRSVAKQVGEVFREIREASGRPRSEIARRAKLDPSVLWRLENPAEGSQPSFNLVRRVANALGASLDEVAQSVERRKPPIEPSSLELLDRIRSAVDSLESVIDASPRRIKKAR